MVKNSHLFLSSESRTSLSAYFSVQFLLFFAYLAWVYFLPCNFAQSICLAAPGFHLTQLQDFFLISPAFSIPFCRGCIAAFASLPSCRAMLPCLYQWREIFIAFYLWFQHVREELTCVDPINHPGNWGHVGNTAQRATLGFFQAWDSLAGDIWVYFCFNAYLLAAWLFPEWGAGNWSSHRRPEKEIVT